MTELTQQKKAIRRTVIVLLVVILCIFLLFLNKFFSEPVLSTDALAAQGVIEFETPRRVEPFHLRDHTEATFDKSRLLEKWTVAYFGFTHCPDICPTTLVDINRALPELSEELRSQVQVVLFTLDPTRDTPAVLKPYVTYFNPNFIGVTGAFPSIMGLTSNVNVAFNKVVLDDGAYTIDHTGNIVIFNPRGDYHGFIRPPFEPAKIRTALSSVSRRWRHN